MLRVMHVAQQGNTRGPHDRSAAHRLLTAQLVKEIMTGPASKSCSSGQGSSQARVLCTCQLCMEPRRKIWQLQRKWKLSF